MTKKPAHGSVVRGSSCSALHSVECGVKTSRLFKEQLWNNRDAVACLNAAWNLEPQSVPPVALDDYDTHFWPSHNVP